MTHIPPNPPPSHERDILPLRGPLWFTLLFLLGGLLLHPLLWLLMGWLDRLDNRHRAAPQINLAPATVAAPLQPSPEHPLLPWQDLAALRAAQQSQLSSYRRDPSDPAFATIPIDRAMQLMLDRHLLTATSQPATQPFLRTETQP